MLGSFLLATLALLAWADEEPAPRAEPDRTAPDPEAERPRARAVEQAPENPPAPAPARAEPGPDPVERGGCTVLLRLVDVRTGRPFESKVGLWRLDAPGNEHWTRGDQLQVTDKVPADGRLFRDLPGGEYRAHVYGERHSARPADSFRVAGPRTLVDLAVEAPGTFHARLRVFDETGAPIHRGALGGVRRRWSVRPERPEWVVAREPRSSHRRLSGSGGGAGGSSGRYGVTADATGFDLGTHRQDDRTKGRRTLRTFVSKDRTSVRVTIRHARAVDRTYYGWSAPLRPIHDSVRLPGGAHAVDRGAYLTASAPATLDAHSCFRQPIEVVVKLDGYATLKFTWRAGDALPMRTMVPAQ